MLKTVILENMFSDFNVINLEFNRKNSFKLNCRNLKWKPSLNLRFLRNNISKLLTKDELHVFK